MLKIIWYVNNWKGQEQKRKYAGKGREARILDDKDWDMKSHPHLEKANYNNRVIMQKVMESRLILKQKEDNEKDRGSSTILLILLI